MAAKIQDDNGVTLIVGNTPAVRSHSRIAISKVIRVTDLNGHYIEICLTETDVDVVTTLLRA